MITICSAEDEVFATVDVDRESTVVRVHIDVCGGHTDAQARDDVLRAVLDLPELARCPKVQFSLPLGDTALLDWVSTHFRDITTRAAGASCLVSARPSTASPSGARESRYISHDRSI